MTSNIDKYQEPPTRRRGPRPKLEDQRTREKLLLLAGKGLSRRGIARITGISRSTIKEWLDRGEAHPKVEPYGSFAIVFLASERGLEDDGASIIHQEMRRLREVQEGGGQITACDREWVPKILAMKYPKEYGVTQNSGRELDSEPDGNAYMQATGLEQHELDDLMKNPPEAIELALTNAADEVVAMLVDSGWRPSRELLERMGQSEH